MSRVGVLDMSSTNPITASLQNECANSQIKNDTRINNQNTRNYTQKHCSTFRLSTKHRVGKIACVNYLYQPNEAMLQ